MKNKSDKDKMRELRPFVNFDYDLRKPLSPQSKAKIRKYWNQLNEAQGQAYRVYRPRDKSRLNKVKEATGFNLSGFDVAIIPSPDLKNPVRVKENKKGEIIFSNKSGDKIFIKFKPRNLINDPDKEIDRAMQLAQGDRIAIACGKFEYRQRFSSKKRAKEQIIQFINTYDDKKSNHYFGNWLTGIYSIKIKNQDLMDVEMQKKAIYKAASKTQRKRLLKGLAKNGKKKNRDG